MHRNIKDIDLISLLLDDSNDMNEEEIANKFVSIIKDKIDLFNTVMNLDLKSVDNKKLYSILNEIYQLDLTVTDLLSILSKKNGVYYNRTTLLPTTMVIESDKNKQVFLNAALSSNTYKKKYKVYSVAEINKMIIDKQIVVFFEEFLNIDDIDFEKEEYEYIPSVSINKSKKLGYDVDDFVKDNLDLFSELFKKNIDKRIILNDLKTMMLDLREQVNDFLAFAKDSDEEYSKLASICKKKYDSSKEKVKYKNIQKKLKHHRVFK